MQWSSLKSQVPHWFRTRFPVKESFFIEAGSEPIPNHVRHWWWCLGGTPAYLLIVQVVTGILLTFHYVPSPDHAYESVRHITENVPYGWYLRSVHKWSSHLFVASIILHMLRVFFTGAYRRPRELTWMTGVLIFLVALVFGFTGYSLVYEQLSYWGATVAGNITEGVPFIGAMLADFIRGGKDIGANTLTRFFAFHIGLLPTLMLLLLASHIALIRLHGVSKLHFKESDFGKMFPFFPDHFMKEMGIAVTLMYVLTLLAIVFPTELGEKANPLVTPEHIKPEWYFYFTFRWLKLTSLSGALFTLTIGFSLLFFWPLVDGWIRRKKAKSEFSVYLGFIVVCFILFLTVWEAVAAH